MSEQRSFGCQYMLYDMSNSEIIEALHREGWKVEARFRDGSLVLAPWHDVKDPTFVHGLDFDGDYAGRWTFRITKGERQYERATDLYPIANQALNSNT